MNYKNYKKYKIHNKKIINYLKLVNGKLNLIN